MRPSESKNLAKSGSLLEKIAQRDAQAFEAFYQIYSRPVFLFLQKRSRDQEIILEILQEVFVTVWKKASYFNPSKGNPDQWVFTIARNKLYDYWRKLERLSEVTESDWSGVEDPGAFFSDSSLTLERSLGVLSDDYRAIVQMIYLDGLTQKECALELGQPLGTIKWKVRRALEQLKENLTRDEKGEGQ